MSCKRLLLKFRLFLWSRKLKLNQFYVAKVSCSVGEFDAKYRDFRVPPYAPSPPHSHQFLAFSQ